MEFTIEIETFSNWKIKSICVYENEMDVCAAAKD